jgi:hypothetical protein
MNKPDNIIPITKVIHFLFSIILTVLFSGCNDKNEQGDMLFKVLDDKKTGLHFTNKLGLVQVILITTT